MKVFIILFSFVSFSAAMDMDTATVSSVLRTLRRRSTSEDTLWKIDSMKLKVKEECAIFGTNDSFSKLETALSDAKMCFREVLTSSIKTHKTKDLRVMIRSLCSVSPKLNRCLPGYAEAVSACSLPAERASVAKFIGSIFDFLCADNLLSSFLTDGGLSCFREQKDGLLQCVKSEDASERQEVAQSSEEQVCKRRDSMRKCVRDHLENCSRPTAVTFFDKIVQAKGSSWTCNHLETI